MKRKSAKSSAKRFAATPAIKTLIATKGYTQASIARTTGLHESYVSRIVSGERSPRVEVVSMIARVLGVSVERLMHSIALGSGKAA